MDEMKYIQREYSLEHFLEKYKKKEFFLSGTLQEWDESLQSYFIESVFLGLPVSMSKPFFAIRTKSLDEDEYTDFFELIDGRKRFLSLFNFAEKDIRLNSLKKLNLLNGFSFKDLPLARQRRFLRSTIKILVFQENVNREYLEKHLRQ